MDPNLDTDPDTNIYTHGSTHLLGSVPVRGPSGISAILRTLCISGEMTEPASRTEAWATSNDRTLGFDRTSSIVMLSFLPFILSLQSCIRVADCNFFLFTKAPASRNLLLVLFVCVSAQDTFFCENPLKIFVPRMRM
jgi:hypothetical protein